MKRLRAVLPCLLLVLPVLADDAIAPGDNLVLDGIPPIPASIAAEVDRYTDARKAALSSWHPTKREMLISTRFADTSQVHLVRFPGGDRTQLTFFKDSAGGASYQPTSGEYLVFNKDAGGDELYQKYRYDLATGDVTLLTDGKSRNTGGAWSNKGDRIAFGSTKRNGKDVDLWVMDPKDPASARMVAQLDGGGWSALDWSPDDKTLLAWEDVSINESYLWLLDLESGKRTWLTERAAGEKIATKGGSFAPNGKGVYVTTDQGSEFQRLAYIDLASRKQTILTPDIPWDVSEFRTSWDGKRVAFVTNEDGYGVLHLLDTSNGKEIPLPALPKGLVGNLSWHKNNRDLGFALESSRSTGDVWSIDVTTKKVERWTTSEIGNINPQSLSEPGLVRFKTFDGKSISAFVYRPDAKAFPGKRPVIVRIHGGPESQYRPGFLARNNYFITEMGIVTIYPNIRGSSGYGKTFLKMDDGFQREDSYKDVAALFDWIKAQPDLDADRVMVTGGSYGGHMTLAIASSYPDRIRCALSIVGISNLVTFLENTSAYRRDLRRVEYGDERDPRMREFLERIAPLNNAKKITKPLFVVQGANDPRVPPTEAEQIVRTLKESGTPVWYLVAKDEGHGFDKKSNADFQLYASILFVREYLLK
jgi:dipeptidyl aminopeptidase/acylaminoacyl peptidase